MDIMDTEESNLGILEPRQKPKIDTLIEEAKRAVSDAGYFLTKLSQAHDVRHCLWSWKDGTGTKPNDSKGRPWGPWTGSSDAEVPLAEEIVLEKNVLLLQAMYRGAVSAQAVEMEDESRSTLAQQVLRYYLTGPMRSEVRDVVSMAVDCRNCYGHALIGTGWKREHRLVERVLSLEDLMAWAVEQGTQDVIQSLSAAVEAGAEMTPEEAAAVEQEINALADESRDALDEMIWTKSKLGELGWIVRQFDPSICPGEDLRTARRLQKGEAEVPYYAKETTVDRPEWRALRPFIDVFYPAETEKLSEARWIMEPVWGTESQMRARAMEEGWDPAWLEDVLKRPGRCFDVGMHTDYADWILSGTGVGMTIPWEAREKYLFCVMRCYYKAVNHAGVTGLYETVIHDNAPKKAGFHRLVPEASGEYPYVELRRERNKKLLIASRGYPEIVESYQWQLKNMVDARQDLTSLHVKPPYSISERLAGSGLRDEMRPGGILPIARDAAPRIMELPNMGGSNLSVQDEQQLLSRVARMFGRVHPDVPDMVVQAVMETEVNDFFVDVSELLRRTFGLIQQYMPELTGVRVAGGPEAFAAASGTEVLQASREDIRGSYDFTIAFDVRDLNIEWVLERAKILADIAIPLDTMAVIDRGPIIRMILASIDPRMAASVKSADRAGMDEVNDELNALSSIVTGGEPPFNTGQNHALRLQVIDGQLKSSPRFQQLIQGDQTGQVAKVLENRMKQHQMQVKQEENKLIGRTGGKPVLGQAA